MANGWQQNVSNVQYIDRTAKSWPKTNPYVTPPVSRKRITAFTLILSTLMLTATAFIMTHIYPFNAIIPLTRQRLTQKTESYWQTHPSTVIITNPRGLITTVTNPLKQISGVDYDGIIYQDLPQTQVTKSVNPLAGLNNPLIYHFAKPWSLSFRANSKDTYTLMYYGSRQGTFPSSITIINSLGTDASYLNPRINLQLNHQSQYQLELDPDNPHTSQVSFVTYHILSD